MKFRYIVGVLILLISCSCNQQNLKSKVQTQKKPNQHLDWNSGMGIENGLIQGLSFTSSLGIEFGHAYSTNTIYNDSTVSINLQLDLSKEYSFPAPNDDKKFKVVIWPQELAPNKVTYTDSLSNELRNFLQSGSDTIDNINISIGPHEKVVLTIGTLFDKSKNCYVSPNELYVHREGSVSGDCENFISLDKSTKTLVALGLRLDLPINDCAITACGQISYAEH